METLLTKRRRELRLRRFNKARNRIGQAVNFLYQAGATEVYLFGSVVQSESFSEHSDIDFAVSGIPEDKRLDVEGTLGDILNEFEYDFLFLEEKGIRKEIRRKIAEEGILWKA